MGNAKTAANKVVQNKVKYDDPRMAYLSTKSELVLKETDLKLNQIYPPAMNDTAVICEDQNGLYVTGKSYVDANVLDPYRQPKYKRGLITVTKNDTEYTIEYNNNMYTITV